jgi:hypothetical protein
MTSNNKLRPYLLPIQPFAILALHIIDYSGELLIAIIFSTCIPQQLWIQQASRKDAAFGVLGQDRIIISGCEDTLPFGGFMTTGLAVCMTYLHPLIGARKDSASSKSACHMQHLNVNLGSCSCGVQHKTPIEPYKGKCSK